MAKRIPTILMAAACFLGGMLVTQNVPMLSAQQGDKGPKWLHAMDLRARKGGEKDFGPDTKKFGVEVFKDENNGNLIYISETGSIAVAPAK
jgi:hypothetical protein